ncbi:MAG: 2-hydroxyhepta-2,4-diene-1,7-dioate isomerase, partial [Planctomycetes bacterium]|nr:2-hydroxyhepta-2,4-diene-1,7-dioate isomerase [Planctomycetota bacterium]
MKLLRYGPADEEKPGLLDQEGNIRDLSSVIDDIDGETLSPEALERLTKITPESLPGVTGDPRLG